MNLLIRNTSIGALFLGLTFIQATYPSPQAWSQMTSREKCLDTLKVVGFLAIVSGAVWGVTEGTRYHFQHQRRVRLVENLQTSFDRFTQEYKKVVEQNPSYEALVEILLDEAKQSTSFFDFHERTQNRKADIEAIGFTLEDVLNMPAPFQEALSELIFRAYISDMSYEDLRWIIRRATESD